MALLEERPVRESSRPPSPALVVVLAFVGGLSVLAGLVAQRVLEWHVAPNAGGHVALSIGLAAATMLWTGAVVVGRAIKAGKPLGRRGRRCLTWAYVLLGLVGLEVFRLFAQPFVSR